MGASVRIEDVVSEGQKIFRCRVGVLHRDLGADFLRLVARREMDDRTLGSLAGVEVADVGEQTSFIVVLLLPDPTRSVDAFVDQADDHA